MHRWCCPLQRERFCRDLVVHEHFVEEIRRGYIPQGAFDSYWMSKAFTSAS